MERRTHVDKAPSKRREPTRKSHDNGGDAGGADKRRESPRSSRDNGAGGADKPRRRSRSKKRAERRGGDGASVGDKGERSPRTERRKSVHKELKSDGHRHRRASRASNHAKGKRKHRTPESKYWVEYGGEGNAFLRDALGGAKVDAVEGWEFRDVAVS